MNIIYFQKIPSHPYVYTCRWKLLMWMLDYNICAKSQVFAKHWTVHTNQWVQKCLHLLSNMVCLAEAKWKVHGADFGETSHIRAETTTHQTRLPGDFLCETGPWGWAMALNVIGIISVVDDSCVCRTEHRETHISSCACMYLAWAQYMYVVCFALHASIPHINSAHFQMQIHL